MNELIKLNPAEKFLDDTGIAITLKEIADEHHMEHKDVLRDFEEITEVLSDAEYDLICIRHTSYLDLANVKQETIELDFKTVVWFIVTMYEDPRAEIVNYAFGKLEKEKLLKGDAKKDLRAYSNETMSVRKCIAESFNDIEEDIVESEVWEALLFKGLVETRARVTTKRVVPSNISEVSSKDSVATYRPATVREAYDKWVEAGKPVRSEYDRLQEELATVLGHYEAKIQEAKINKK